MYNDASAVFSTLKEMRFSELEEKEKHKKEKQNRKLQTESMTQMMEQLPNKHEVLNCSILSTDNKKEKKSFFVFFF
jgi:Ni,Fe-hydrogenase III component G